MSQKLEKQCILPPSDGTLYFYMKNQGILQWRLNSRIPTEHQTLCSILHQNGPSGQISSRLSVTLQDMKNCTANFCFKFQTYLAYRCLYVPNPHYVVLFLSCVLVFLNSWPETTVGSLIMKDFLLQYRREKVRQSGICCLCWFHMAFKIVLSTTLHCFQKCWR